MGEAILLDAGSVELVEAFCRGDEQAATVLFDRYRDRLVTHAARQMSSKLQQRLDAEDLYQSACLVFIRGVEEGRYKLRQTGDLWNLLAQITINRLRNKVDYHTAAMRSVYREDFVDDRNILAREPSPEDAALLMDEVNNLLSEISNVKYRRVVKMGLEGRSTREIAEATHYSQERVRQIIKRVTQQRRAALEAD